MPHERPSNDLGEQGWDGVTDKGGYLFLSAEKTEGIIEGLQSRPFAQCDVPVLERMGEAPSRETVEPCRNRARRLVRVEAAVDCSVPNSRCSVLMRLHPQVDRQVLKATARRNKAQSCKVLLRKPRAPVKRVPGQGRVVLRWRREVTNRLPGGALLTRPENRWRKGERRHHPGSPSVEENPLSRLRYAVLCRVHAAHSNVVTLTA